MIVGIVITMILKQVYSKIIATGVDKQTRTITFLFPFYNRTPLMESIMEDYPRIIKVRKTLRFFSPYPFKKKKKTKQIVFHFEQIKPIISIPR